MNDRRTERPDLDLDVDTARDRILSHVTTFVRDLRRAGADVPANAGIDAMRALTVVGFGDRQRVRVALRTTLVSRRTDTDVFDELFPPFWERLTNLAGSGISERERSRGESGRTATSAAESPHRSDDVCDSGSLGSDPATDRTEDTGVENWGDESNETEDRSEQSSHSSDSRRRIDAENSENDSVRSTVSSYSRTGTPELVDEAAVADAERLDEAVRKMTRAIATLRGRQWDRTTGGNRVDMRRALRRSFATGGTVADIPRHTRRTTGVRCLLLVDVSRSVLDTIDREFLLRFLRSVSDAWRSVRIFFFDTSVREVTAQFQAQSTANAARALRRVETEWGGGTRIGHAIESVRRTHPYAVDRTTTVFVISDGLEVDEIDRLEAGVARLARLSSALLWLNPLAASPMYEPTAGGMAVSLPYLDGLFAFTGTEDIAEIARQLRLHGLSTNVGYQHDQRTRNC
ncbi:VWA domain-containing protein [Halostagnicola sp. A-GB9-2]|uniref:vWA domain-containing protein n=1 Tax=Halostagnicola sp. A-GB9-2 TaxID=3048066 RepID=UPI0024BFA906|nr:VWA domain-containing protein [Halostagnicola sp. A-GB9-2]MDJ1434747.1 VWA domain-containing protein [Halostagnicola sp. A-GB9-2]